MSYDEKEDEELPLYMEGEWDENTSLTEIHKHILTGLLEEMECLKERYKQLRNSQNSERSMRVLKRITNLRVKYDRLVEDTKNIIQSVCNKPSASDATPCTRIMWIRDLQFYFHYISEFLHADISLGKISPGLFRFAQITGTETPSTLNKKKNIAIYLRSLIEKERSKRRTNSLTRMKKMEDEYLPEIPKRFSNPERGFPDRWIDNLSEPFSRFIQSQTDTLTRWYFLFRYIAMDIFHANFSFHGICPACNFPLISDSKGVQQHCEINKLFCPECSKELDWTYYPSDTEIKAMEKLIHESLIFDFLACIENRNTDKEITKKRVISGETEPPLSIPEGEVIATKPLNSASKPHLKKGRRKEYNITNLIQSSREYLINNCVFYNENRKNIGEEEDDKRTQRNYELKIREAVSIFIRELYSFQGFPSEKIPSSVTKSVDSYMRRVYNIPTKDIVRGMELDDKGSRVAVSRKMVLESLKECGLTKMACNVTSIMASLWWCSYPSISSEDEEKIIRTFICQRELFERVKCKYGRKANFSTCLCLGRLLSKYGYPFDETDIRIFEDSDNLSKQIDMWNECIHLLEPL